MCDFVALMFQVAKLARVVGKCSGVTTQERTEGFDALHKIDGIFPKQGKELALARHKAHRHCDYVSLVSDANIVSSVSQSNQAHRRQGRLSWIEDCGR
ncbi:MAG: hypothetical protein NVSMB22_01450 [Chloroflexota bacterium]